jgi:hypothetical protein
LIYYIVVGQMNECILERIIDHVRIRLALFRLLTNNGFIFSLLT